MIDPAKTEIKGAAPKTQDPLIPIIAPMPVMLLERIPTQSFSLPLLTKKASTRFNRAMAINPNKMVATNAASDSTFPPNKLTISSYLPELDSSFSSFDLVCLAKPTAPSKPMMPLKISTRPTIMWYSDNRWRMPMATIPAETSAVE